MSIIYKSINNDQGDEIFTTYIATWNISKLIDYLEESQIYLNRLNKNQYQCFIINEQNVDKSKIDLVDLNKPIIVAKYSNNSCILIDGIHRVRKAHKYNQEYIYAYMLPFEEHIKFVETRAQFNNIIEFNNALN